MNATQLKADLSSHHIEGYAHQDPMQMMFSVPLISQVDETLWQGGCKDGVDLQGFFRHIVSLYPWERFNPGEKDLDSFTEVRLYDGPVVPSPAQLFHLARWVNLCRKTGPVLVHCQAGLNRSALVTALALMLEGLTAEVAIAKVRQRSPQVLCNPKFEQWLKTKAESLCRRTP